MDPIKGWCFEKRYGLSIYKPDGSLIYSGSTSASALNDWFRDIDEDLADAVLWWMDLELGRDRSGWASVPPYSRKLAPSMLEPRSTLRV